MTEGSEDISVHPLRRTRFPPPAARASTLELKSRFEACAHSVSSVSFEFSVSRCEKVGVAMEQENSRSAEQREQVYHAKRAQHDEGAP
jgi:hypothetical protein